MNQRKLQFGVFWKYLQRPNVTDVDYNGSELWITDLKIGRYRVKEHLSDAFISTFTHNISNCVNRQFNNANKVLEADTRELRISIIHEAAAASGTSICIRKSPSMVRMNIERMLEESYCPERILQLLMNCVLAGMNFVFGGEPGAGKTECAKFFMQFIPREERVITLRIRSRSITGTSIRGRMRGASCRRRFFLHGCHQGEHAAESEVACPLGGKVGGGDVAARAVEYRRERLYDDPPG